MKMKNVESMFAGRFTVVARMEHEIKDRVSGEVSKYYEFVLSNGYKVMPVTCGKNSPLMETKMGVSYDMEFTADMSKGYAKIKVTHIERAVSGSDAPIMEVPASVRSNAPASSQSK